MEVKRTKRIAMKRVDWRTLADHGSDWNRMVVQEGTITACQKNSFTLPDGEKVKVTSKEELAKQVWIRRGLSLCSSWHLCAAWWCMGNNEWFCCFCATQVRSCVMYDFKTQYEFNFPNIYGSTKVEVIEKDCLEAAINLKQKGWLCHHRDSVGNCLTHLARTESSCAQHGFAQTTWRWI